MPLRVTASAKRWTRGGEREPLRFVSRLYLAWLRPSLQRPWVLVAVLQGLLLSACPTADPMRRGSAADGRMPDAAIFDSAERGDARPAGDLQADHVVQTECPADILCNRSPLYTSEIGTWYMGFWTTSGPHADIWQRWARYRPQIGYYRSGEPSAFAKELARFDAMRIDFLLLDHTNGTGALDGTVSANLGEVVRQLDSRGRPGQAVAFGCALWCGTQADHTLQSVEADIVWNDYADPQRHASAYIFKGKPLAVVYTAPNRGDTWSDSRFQLGAATGRMREASLVMRARGLFGWVADEPTIVHPDVMVVMPGWDSAHLGRDTVPIAREANGARFQRDWLRAIAANPKLIVIASWNGFEEETAIQPARPVVSGAPAWLDARGNACPEIFFDIARVYSLMRWGLAHGSYVREVSQPRVFHVEARGLRPVTALPDCQAIVHVPDGYLAQFARR